MVLKGNLLYNGDFERGSIDGWELAPYGLTSECQFTVSQDAKLRGNYGGYIKTTQTYGDAYIAYDKICSFEEYEGFLFILPVFLLFPFPSSQFSSLFPYSHHRFANKVLQISGGRCQMMGQFRLPYILFL